MNRFSFSSLASAFAGAIAVLSPLAANAQAAPAADFTPDQVQAQYVAQGFQVDAPVTWWTSNHVTTFRVSDPSSSRVIMVMVYPDTATAEAERSAAQPRDTSAAGNGPHLIPGYGYSTWRQNVALVESTIDNLGRQYADEQAADSQVTTGLAASDESANLRPTYAVDLDIIGVIDGGTVNL